MQRVLRLCLVAALLLFVIFDLQAQSSEGVKAQEDFAIAVAAAHARTSLFVAGSKPFAIHATVVSGLALRGIGQGTYENQWIDAQHWHRVIQFPDFQQTEMINDSGHSWIEQSDETIPLRIGDVARHRHPRSQFDWSIGLSRVGVFHDRRSWRGSDVFRGDIAYSFRRLPATVSLVLRQNQRSARLAGHASEQACRIQRLHHFPGEAGVHARARHIGQPSCARRGDPILCIGWTRA